MNISSYKKMGKTREMNYSPIDQYHSLPKSTDNIRKKGIAAVIPAFNEGALIGSVVLKTLKYTEMAIVVDDGSTDDTSEIAQRAGAEVVRLPRNNGKAHAMMYGFDLAKQLGYSTVVMLDGDGQHNPDEIPSLIKPILDNAADLVIGSRLLCNGGKIPLHRRFGQVLLNAFTNASSNTPGFRATDSQSGFRVLNSNALRNLDFRSEGYSIESDMITHFTERGLRILEIPIEAHYNGLPHVHKQNSVVHGFDVLSKIIGNIGYKRPMLIFLIPGAFLLTFGIISGSFAFSQYYATQIFSFGLTIICLITLISGLLLISSALILNSLIAIIKMYLT